MDQMNLKTGEYTIISTKRKIEYTEPPKKQLFDKIKFQFNQENNKDEFSLRTLATQVAICCIAIVVLLALTVFVNPAPETGNAALANESEGPELDIGRLQFVENDTDYLAVTGTIPEVVMPVSGTIVTLFDGDKQLGITFSVEQNSGVVSATMGTVIETTPYLVRVGMDDGRVILYKGLSPGVLVGDYLSPGDTLGFASSNEISIALIEDNKAIDPLVLLSHIR
jgi:hypothetical protein